MRASNIPLGILCLIAGVAIFSVQDLILKLLADRYPLHQAMVLRSLAAIPCLLVLVRVMDGGFGGLLARSWPAMLARGVLNFAAYTAYYLALAALPMATTVALYFTAPLMITVLSVFLLHEKVSGRRWLAVAMGFAGIFLMMRPGSSLFDWAALLPVFCGVAYAMSMVLARVMGARDSAAALAFWGNIAFLLCALALSAVYGGGAHAEASHPSLAFLTRGWVMPTTLDLFLMCACGLIAAIGLTLLTQAYRVAPNSAVAPFEFSFAFWGVLWGWLIWGDLPDGLGWLGLAVIIGAGLVVTAAPKEKAAPEGAA